MMIPIIYSIAETAKANNLKPFDFFEYLLTEIPKYVDDKNTDFLAELLPFTIILDMQYDLIKKNFPFCPYFICSISYCNFYIAITFSIKFICITMTKTREFCTINFYIFFFQKLNCLHVGMLIFFIITGHCYFSRCFTICYFLSVTFSGS